MRKKYYFVLLISYLLIIFTLILFWISQKNNLKKQLLEATHFVNEIVPEALIDSAYNKKNFPILYYDSLRNILNNTADNNNFEYLYVIIPQKDSFLFVISSYNRIDILNNMISKYLSPYYYYPSKIKKLSPERPVMFLKYTDEYGSFFSAFHYYITDAHHPYIVGADYDLNIISSLNWKFIFIILAVTIIFIFALLLNFNCEYKIKNKK
ncbi:MAG TPA: hypothetical protein PLO66_02740 [Bacteroidales bacterium]|nr:hypothetical protein [Bacteroidales bacterium]